MLANWAKFMPQVAAYNKIASMVNEPPQFRSTVFARDPSDFGPSVAPAAPIKPFAAPVAAGGFIPRDLPPPAPRASWNIAPNRSGRAAASNKGTSGPTGFDFRSGGFSSRMNPRGGGWSPAMSSLLGNLALNNYASGGGWGSGGHALTMRAL